MGPLRTIEAVSAWVGRMANSRDKSWWHYWCHICQWTDCTCNDHHKTGISSCFMQVDTFNLTTNIDYRLPTFTFLFCPTGHHCILWWACDRAHLRRDHDQLKTTQSPAWLMIMCPWQCPRFHYHQHDYVPLTMFTSVRSRSSLASWRGSTERNLFQTVQIALYFANFLQKYFRILCPEKGLNNLFVVRRHWSIYVEHTWTSLISPKTPWR